MANPIPPGPPSPPPSPPLRPPVPWYRNAGVWILVGIMVFVVVLANAGPSSGSGSSSSSAARTTSTSATASSSARATSLAMVAPAPPAAPRTPEQATGDSIISQLGQSNRNVARAAVRFSPNGTYEVLVNLNDGFFDGLTRTSARRDVVAIIRAVKTNGLPVKRLVIVGSFPMTDAYGNTANTQVVNVQYSAPTLDRINTEGIDWVTSNNIYAVADRAQVAPAFLG